MPQHVVVVGAGVIGLSSALLLRQAGHAVTIVARDFPEPFETIDPLTKINYTSPLGRSSYAFPSPKSPPSKPPPPPLTPPFPLPKKKDNRWVPPHHTLPAHLIREHALSRTTYTHMQRLFQAHPHTAGITFCKGIEYMEQPGPAQTETLSTPANPNALDLPGFRLLERGEFPAGGSGGGGGGGGGGVTWGCEYDTWCVNPMVYCAFLLRRFVNRGGRIVRRELRRPEEVFALSAAELGLAVGGDGDKKVPVVAAVVNASGTGLVPDPDMTITRGQTCLVAEDCDATVTRQNVDGTWTFCVPRGFEGGTIIGGTKELNNWDTKPSAEVRAELLRKFVETYPKILGGKKELTVVRDIVGRRPTRNGGPRIEGEVVPGAGFVMHAYGLGGRGYELSWGVAEAVVEGVETQIQGTEAKL